LPTLSSPSEGERKKNKLSNLGGDNSGTRRAREKLLAVSKFPMNGD
jgi:hypothetical protein